MRLQDFGAIPTQTRLETRKEFAATDAFQQAANVGGVLVVDDYFYLPGTVAITKPLQIILTGKPGHIYPGGMNGANQPTSQYQPGLGCLYAGPNPRDMFHVFTSGFHCSGGLIDLRNCLYDGAQPYYVPPAVFRYSYWQNLIMSGSLDVEIAGNQTEAVKFNGGHIGVFFDGSRSDLPSDPKSYPYGFMEMHYCSFKVRGNFLYAPVFGNESEPYQDYSNVINHPSVGGCGSMSQVVNGQHVADSTPNYYVPVRTPRRLTIRWGKSSIVTLPLEYRSGSFVDLINQGLRSEGLSGLFQAAVFPGGSNQSFRIVGTSQFSFRIYRPNSCNLHEYDIVSNGCKTIHVGTTGDTSKVKARFQTFPMLAKSGNPGNVLDEELSEWSLPCYSVSGHSNQIDCQYIDLNKGSTATHKANAVAITNKGNDNEPIGTTLAAVENGHAIESTPFVNTKQLNRNNRFFSQTNWTTSTGKDGFIGDLDDCLTLADKRFPIATTALNASIANTQSLFKYSNYPITTIIYNPAFTDSDYVEVKIEVGGLLEIVALYLWIDSVNRPNAIELISQGSSSTATKVVDLKTHKGNLFVLEGMNTNNTMNVIVRFHGVQDKSQPVTIKRLSAKNKHPFQNQKPVLTIEGNQTVYGSMDFQQLKISGRPITPQASGAVATVQELVDKLKQTGILT